MFGAAYTSHHPGQLQLLFITNFVEESPFLGADSFSASQKIFHNLHNVEVHLQCSKELPLVHILIHIDPVHILPSYLFKISFNLYSHLCLGLPSDLFLQDFPLKVCMHFSTLPFMLHTPPISSSFT